MLNPRKPAFLQHVSTGFQENPPPVVAVLYGLRSYPLGWWGHPLTRWTDPAVFTAETTARIWWKNIRIVENDCLMNIKCSPNLWNICQNPICCCWFHGIVHNDCLMGLFIFHAWIQCVDWSVASRMVIIVRPSMGTHWKVHLAIPISCRKLLTYNNDL